MSGRGSMGSIYPDEYKMDTEEIVIAAAMKSYLLGLGEVMARTVLSGIVDPRVIRIGEVQDGCGKSSGSGQESGRWSSRGSNHSGVPMPLQSTIDGVKLAALIEEAAHTAVESVYDGMMGTPGSRGTVVAVLERIDGKTAVESMSAEFLQFVVDCYRAVRY